MFKLIGNFIIRYRPKLIILVSAFLFLLSMLNFYFLFFISPQSNDECLWKPRKINNERVIIFDFVKFDGVSWKAGIRDGDKLLEIDHTPVNRTFDAQIILNRFNSGDSVHYAVERNGNVINTFVQIKKLYSFQGIGFALLGFIWLIVGFIVVMAKPEGYTQLLFWRLGALFTLVATQSYFIVGEMQNLYLQNSTITMIVDFLWLVGSTFIPFLIVHFFWQFPTKKKILDRKNTLKILYGIPLTLFILALSHRIYLFEFLNSKISMLGFVNKIFLFALPPLFIFIGLVWGLVSLFRSYLNLKSKNERNAIFVILVSYFIGIASLVYTYTFANFLTVSIFNNPEYFMPIIFVAIIPVAFGYSIFRYSLMDISDVVKNTILYGLATIAVAGSYFLVIYTLGQSISQMFGTEYQGIFAAIIFIIFAIVFQSTKDRFQEIVTRKFYPEQFAFQKVLLKFSKEISSVVGLNNILDATLENFVAALNIKHFGIALKAEDDSFELKRSIGFIQSDMVLKNVYSKIKNDIEEKKSLRKSLVIESVDFPKIFGEEASKLNVENIYTIIPLIVKSKYIGLIFFGLKQSGAQFMGKDLELLSASVNQVAVSVENARLYLSEADKFKLDQEIENARKIQQSLLPNDIPKIRDIKISGKMIPAMQIGGDYYDFIKLSDNKLFVVIGDVSGKGLAASFYMSKIQTMVRLFCKDSNSPKEILQKINSNIFNELGKNWFITVTLALFDTETMKVTYCRAGHTPFTYVREGIVYEDIPSGIGVGLESGIIFKESLSEKTIEIKYGDLFVLYSDGLTEAMNSNKELYGEERMFACLKENFNKEEPKQIMDELLNSIENFVGSSIHSDDITIALIKIH